MIAYLYRWKIRPEHEDDFIQAWSKVTAHLLSQGSLGSRLHRGDDGLFYAYAQWPDEQTFAAVRFAGPEAEALRELMKQAADDIFLPVLLEQPVDYLARQPVTPTLTTDRLVLRPHRVSDFAAVHALWADPNVYRFISGKPGTEQQTWDRVQRYAGQWALLGYGPWAVTEKQSGAYVGVIGFADYRRAVEPAQLLAPELGWVVSPHFWGKGYATEALRCVQAWGDTHFGKASTYCIIHPENTASLKVASKIGYEPLGDAEYEGHPVKVFQRVAR